MTVSAVIELSGELRRLAAAGVGLARNDRRVAALVPVLEASGAKAAVFARIASQATALIEAPKARVAADFLALNTLVGAVLKTQGRTALEGGLTPLPASSTEPKPLTGRLLEALGAGADGGRMEALDDAFDRGLFGDARLAPFALEALHSDAAEIANLAAARMLPAYGPAIVPFLTASLDLGARRAAARTLEAIRGADPAAAATLARAILDPDIDAALGVRTNGDDISDEAIVTALESLEDTGPDRALLHEHLSAKRKVLRVAALRRLLAFGDEAAAAHAAKMLGASATKMREAAEALPALTHPTHPTLSAAALERAAGMADLLDAVTAKAPLKETDANAAIALLGALSRAEPDAVTFEAILRLCAHARLLERGRNDFRDGLGLELIAYLIEHCPPARHSELMSLLLTWHPERTAAAFICRLGPVRALDLLEASGHDQVAASLQGANELCGHHGHRALFPDIPCPPAPEWGVRWLDLSAEHGLTKLASYLSVLDPARLVDGLLAPKLVAPVPALLALTLDPTCASRLSGRLSGNKRGHGRGKESVQALCAALAAGDRAAALKQLAHLQARGPWVRGLDALRTVLDGDTGT